MKQKQILRSSLQQGLQKMSQSLYEHYSKKIASILFELEEWKSADTIAITVSRKPEVDTYAIISHAWDNGKTVVVPKCFPNNRTMKFYTLKSFQELETVFYGLKEPILSKTVEMDKKDIDLVIVPGLGFTSQGYRLGFGGGYYDRFLIDYNGKTISLAFSEQLVDTLPIEPHDIPVGKLVTSEGVVGIND